MGKYNPPVPVFMSSEEKEEWSKGKYQFMITSARTAMGKFGKAFTYELQRRDAKTNEVSTRYITMTANIRREVEFDYIAGEIAKDGECGPCLLSSVPGQGNDAWVFVGA